MFEGNMLFIIRLFALFLQACNQLVGIMEEQLPTLLADQSMHYISYKHKPFNKICFNPD